MILPQTDSQPGPERVQVGTTDELPPGSRKQVTAGDRTVTVFNVDGNLYAIHDLCPHRGGSLGSGDLQGNSISCPLHQWQFDLRTGECAEHSESRVECFDVFVADDNVLVEITPQVTESADAWDGISRYLIRYGAMGWVGHFGSIDRIDCNRGDHIVIQTSRGVEIGEGLDGPSESSNSGSDEGNQKPAGEVLRLLTQEDEQQRASAVVGDGGDILDRCRHLISEQQLPVEVIDCEWLLDRSTVVLYFLGEESPQMQPMADELGNNDEFRVLFQPVIEPVVQPSESGGCGSPGCGNGQCHA